MDRNVTVRFYEIRDIHGHAPDLEAVLSELDARAKRDREYAVDDGVVLRLEHLERRGRLLIGDITRVQSRNLPGHVVDNDVNRLPVDQIGHSTAFLYDPDTRCLAAQFDMQTGVGRLCRYLREAGRQPDFAYFPYLRQDILERFRSQTPTKLRVRIARVRNFAHLGDAKTDFEDQLEDWANTFDAPSIEITLSTRGEGNQLDAAQVWNTVRRWISFNAQIGGIKNIEASTVEADEAFNFIKDLLCESATLDLPDNNPISSRTVRQNYVIECYDLHRSYIKRATGLD